MIVEFSGGGSDLEPIVHYIANDNPPRALSFVQELRGKCEALAYNPLGFPLVPQYEGYGIRRQVHGTILFSIV
ncbi:type II toxin-antitoxin system RelE/ParE family toxin [Agrobacterium tumefaciens]|uniref:type II toxin-antitoxin system RelE/ParE family toxin n=1 Tax=Agrobacterium TaxID=357 RepID=UPI003C6C0273